MPTHFYKVIDKSMSMQPEIDDVNHPLMRLTRELLSPNGRMTHRKFIIDDPENIMLALDTGIQVEQVFFYGDHADRHQEFLNQLSSSMLLYPIRPRTCKKIFGTEKLARVFAIANMPEAQPLSCMKEDIAVLDGLMITGNMGAIVRSALAFEISGVVLLNMERHDLYDRRLIRASKGYIFKLPMACVPSADFFAYCKRSEIQILNCSHRATANIADVITHPGRFAIMLGAETSGVSNEVERVADFDAKIPYNPAVESLNVSVAAAIIFYSRYHHLTQK